ncbi:unnamed protein product [Phytomonas sp. EM1]|nr:unnamed protein product [Phytomonas sp. EM1]|eukprot:CCW63221.1 unnamed protein product [Phytomonas sp. isolate EM1]
MKASLRLFSLSRSLNPSELLKTIRADPGMTAVYYANRYFGSDKVMQINHILWGQLKRCGKIYHERGEEEEALPRWFPTFGMARIHRVQRHDPNEEDLSLLNALKDARSEASAWSDSPGVPAHSEVSFDSNTNNDDAKGEDTLEVEMAVMREVQKEPGKDIQHYIHRLPKPMQRSAPLAFKRLRESGMIKREFTSAGSFIWS